MNMSKNPDSDPNDEVKQAGALAFDILGNGFHHPISADGLIDVDNIHDKIIIGLYAGWLGPVSQEVVDMAIETIQELIDSGKYRE